MYAFVHLLSFFVHFHFGYLLYFCGVKIICYILKECIMENATKTVISILQGICRIRYSP